MLGYAALIAFALAFLGPIAALVARVEPGALRELLSSASFHKALYATVISGTGGALIALGLALVFARQFALHDWRGKRLQRLLLLIPYLVPNFVLAVAYSVSWNSASGLLNGIFRFPFGLYGLSGMTLLLGVAHMPVAFLLLEEKFRRIDPALREAARLSGASVLKIAWLIEIPLVLPTLTSAFGLCFALCMSAFAIPAWIGAPEHVYPLTYKIYQAIQLGGADGIPDAAVYSIVLFVLAIPPLLLASYSQKNEKRFAMVSGKPSRGGEDSQSSLGTWIFQTVFWVTQLTLWIAPLGCLFLTTWVKPGCLQQSGAACFSDLTARSYSYVLFELADTRAGIQGSLIYGSLSAGIIVVLAVLSLAIFSRSRRQSTLAEWIFSVPVATPGAILALGLIVLLSGRFWLNLYNTPYIVVVAYVIKHFNLSYQPLRTGLANVSSSLTEAARLSGARSFETWRRITLPILRPELLGGFFLVLIPILGELTMSVFLTSPSFRSIGTVVFDLQDYSDQASASALSILLVAMVLVLNQGARFLSKGKLGY